MVRADTTGSRAFSSHGSGGSLKGPVDCVIGGSEGRGNCILHLAPRRRCPVADAASSRRRRNPTQKGGCCRRPLTSLSAKAHLFLPPSTDRTPFYRRR